MLRTRRAAAGLLDAGVLVGLGAASGGASAATAKTGQTIASQSHCRTGNVTHAYSKKTTKGRVSSQSRKPGRRYTANTRVDLVVSLGKP